MKSSMHGGCLANIWKIARVLKKRVSIPMTASDHAGHPRGSSWIVRFQSACEAPPRQMVLQRRVSLNSAGSAPWP
jgi:hypothetical protein